MKAFIKIFIKISISVGLLIFLFSRINIDFKKLIDYIQNAHPFYFILAFLLFIFIAFLGLIRWWLLLRILKKDLSIWRIFVSYCGGLFFNVFLPSTIGGDIARITDLSLHTKDTASIFATVFLDRISGFFGLIIIALFGFLFGYIFNLTRDLRLLMFIGVFAGILVSVFTLIFSKRFYNVIHKIIKIEFLRGYLTKLHNSCYSFRSKKKALVETILLSLLIQGAFSMLMYFIGLSLGIKINAIYYLILIPITNIAAFLPVSFGGLGVRDSAAVVLFGPLGVGSDKVVLLTLINFALMFFIGIIGGIIYGFALYRRRV